MKTTEWVHAHIKDSKLEALKHWQVIEILRAIEYNGQDCLSLWENPHKFPGNYHEPVDMENIQESRPVVQELIRLIEDGWHILYESRSYHGADGGSLLMIYLASPENYKDCMNEIDDSKPATLHEMEWITRNPEKVLGLWSGPY